MASPQTKQNGEIVPRSEIKPAEQMAKLVQAMTPELARALPKHITGERMARIVLTAMRVNPRLAECTQASFLGCVLSCAVLGLEPNTPLQLAFLIPRKNNKAGGRLECSLQIGYQGMIDLAARAGANVYAFAVRQGDDFRYQLGDDPRIHHVPSEAPDRRSKPITHAYAVAVAPDGRKNFTVLNVAEIEERRALSPAKDEGPWVTHYEQMCCKTAVRAHFRWMPKQTEKATIMAHGIALEEAAENGTPLLEAMDPAVADAMRQRGLDEEQPPTIGNS